MGATIDDVAKAVGVSTATVSRALRGLENVTEATRLRVQAAAEELGYIYDSNAARLASQQSMTIGVITPLADQWFYNTIFANADGLLKRNAYDVLRYSLEDYSTLKQFLAEMLPTRRFDGLILVSINPTPSEVNALQKRNILTVTVETATESLSSVSIDNIAAAKTATQHLISLGHERIAVIIGQLERSIVEARLAGFQLAMDANNLPIHEPLMIETDNTIEGGQTAMRYLLGLSPRPSGVFVLTDEMAMGALKAVAEQGGSVPGDVSVVGFDDQRMAKYFGLTTIAQPIAHYGETAANILLALQKEPDEIHHTVLTHKLVIRTSTSSYTPQ